MKRWMPALVAVAMAAGCEGIVLDPVGGGGGSTATTTVSGSGATATGSSALAMKGSDFTPGSLQWNGTGFAPWDRPDSLVLLMGSGQEQCASPSYSIDCDGQGRWQTILTIPAELDAAGTIDLTDSRIGAYELTLDPGCARALGSGNGFSGTLEISALDESSVSFTLKDSGGSGHPPANGTYVAPRCGTPP